MKKYYHSNKNVIETRSFDTDEISNHNNSENQRMIDLNKLMRQYEPDNKTVLSQEVPNIYDQDNKSIVSKYNDYKHQYFSEKRKNYFIPDFNNIEHDILEQVIDFCGLTSFQVSQIFSQILMFLQYGILFNFLPTMLVAYKEKNYYSQAETLIINVILFLGVAIGNSSIKLQYKLSSNRRFLLRINMILELISFFLFIMIDNFVFAIIIRIVLGFFMGFTYPCQNSLFMEALPYKWKAFLFINLFACQTLGQFIILLFALAVNPNMSSKYVVNYEYLTAGFMLLITILYCISSENSPKHALNFLGEEEGFSVLHNLMKNNGKKIILNNKIKKTILFELKYPYLAMDLKKKRIEEQTKVEEKKAYKEFMMMSFIQDNVNKSPNKNGNMASETLIVDNDNEEDSSVEHELVDKVYFNGKVDDKRKKVNYVDFDEAIRKQSMEILNLSPNKSNNNEAASLTLDKEYDKNISSMSVLINKPKNKIRFNLDKNSKRDTNNQYSNHDLKRIKDSLKEIIIDIESENQSKAMEFSALKEEELMEKEKKLSTTDHHLFDFKYKWISICNACLIIQISYISFSLTAIQDVLAKQAGDEHFAQNPNNGVAPNKYEIYYQLLLNAFTIPAPGIASAIIFYFSVGLKYGIIISELLSCLFFLLCIINESNLIIYASIGNGLNSLTSGIVMVMIGKSYDIRINDVSIGVLFLIGVFSILFGEAMIILLNPSNSAKFAVFLILCSINLIVCFFYPEVDNSIKTTKTEEKKSK